MLEFDYKKWGVQRASKAKLLNFLIEGLTLGGCAVLWASEPDHAPFLIVYETELGERHGVLVYAFLANSKETLNRPQDEHRFQIKYGSDPKAILPLERDPSRLITTIFVGVDLEREVVVAADPVLHDGTKMFISLEFKRSHVEAVQRNAWHAWERDSSKRDGEPVEVLVGVTKRRVADLVRFERLALGLDPGHRQLLAEQFLGNPVLRAAVTPHTLATELELSGEAILDLIQGARRLKMAVRGWVAEHHLERLLSSVPGVEDCKRLDEEGKPDITLRYRGSEPMLIECKNALRTTTSDGTPRVDFQRTRASKSDPCSRYYRPDDFNILAACLHSITERWEFRFALTSSLPAHGKCVGRIQNNLKVGTGWAMDPVDVFRAVAKQ
ncbi:hypothetical protein [Variovorax guangxiensis]|uniref:hypothetical protein n=1 Tax=Variovorax guangxiensis TaxID=1775474 RepID=UPI00197EAFA1|nr:hypothetical protein [Variovorax guangxiensis]